MAGLSTIRQALSDTVDNVPGLRAFPTFQSQVNPPVAIIMPQRGQLITWDTLEGSVTYSLQVVLLVSYGEDASSQAAMDAFLDSTGANSVLGVLRTTPTLGGVVQYCEPVSVSGYGTIEWAGSQYYGCTVNVQAVVL